MSQESDDTEKSHEPTQKKLTDARKKGEIIRSNDVSTAAAYAGLWAGLAMFGAGWMVALASVMMPFIARADPLAQRFLTDPAFVSIGTILQTTAIPLGAWMGLPMTAAALVILAQQGFVFAPSKLMPKASRLSPLENAKNKFGRSGLFEFFKSFAKLVIYSLALTLFLRANMSEMIAAVRLSPGQITLLMADLILRLLLVVTGVSVVLAVVDYTFQRAEFLRKNRMSHKDLRDEAKESEGDPMMKAQRRMRAQEIAFNSMMADVPKADVVIVNPTHFAVALKWNAGQQSAPVCVAKGVDHAAKRIREVAAQSGVPLHSDPPTARALHATIEVGAEIDVAHYAAVAAAIRFAQDMRSRARQGSNL